MADRITLNFGANTSDVEQGTDRIADSLDDVDRKLGDLGETGEQAGSKAAGGLDDVADSSLDVGGKLGDLGSIASDVLEGDVAGGAKTAVSALSGLAALIPGIGAVIGSGLALAANAFIGQWDAAAKANEDRIKDMYDDMIKSGNDFASAEFVNSKIHDAIEDEGALSAAKENAAAVGVRLGLVLRAEAGDQTALASVVSALRTRREELNAQQETYIAKNGQVSAAIDEQIGFLDEYQGALANTASNTESAASKADVYRQATENAGTATGKLGDALNDLPGTVVVDVKVNTDGAQKQIDAFIADQRRRNLPLNADVIDRLTGKRLP